MTILARIMFVLLRASLYLFPRRYRHAFREERAGVLRLALEEAAASGWLCLRSRRFAPGAPAGVRQRMEAMGERPLRAALDKHPTPVYNTCALEVS